MQKHECKRAQLTGTARASLAKRHMEDVKDEAGRDRRGRGWNISNMSDSSIQLRELLLVGHDSITARQYQSITITTQIHKKLSR